jgi:hypothetical protein
MRPLSSSAHIASVPPTTWVTFSGSVTFAGKADLVFEQ